MAVRGEVGWRDRRKRQDGRGVADGDDAQSALLLFMFAQSN